MYREHSGTQTMQTSMNIGIRNKKQEHDETLSWFPSKICDQVKYIPIKY